MVKFANTVGSVHGFDSVIDDADMDDSFDRFFEFYRKCDHRLRKCRAPDEDEVTATFLLLPDFDRMVKN